MRMAVCSPSGFGTPIINGVFIDHPDFVPYHLGMEIQIRYCAPCGYRQRALDLADELRRKFDAHVDAKEGKLGQFDVFVDGMLVTAGPRSLLARMLRRPPHAAEVIHAITQALSPKTEEACPWPAKDHGTP